MTTTEQWLARLEPVCGLLGHADPLDVLQGRAQLRDMVDLEAWAALRTQFLFEDAEFWFFEEWFLEHVPPVERAWLSLLTLQKLDELSGVQALHLSRVRSLDAVLDILEPLSISSLLLSASQTLEDLRPLCRLTHLTTLQLVACPRVTDVSPLIALTGLRCLSLAWCHSVTDIGSLAGMAGLTSLDLSWCRWLRDVSPLSALTGLTQLRLQGTAIRSIASLSGLTGLTQLNLSWCRSLQDIDALQGLPVLEALDLTWCDAVRDVDALSQHPSLQQVALLKCGPLLTPVMAVDVARRLAAQEPAGPSWQALVHATLRALHGSPGGEHERTVLQDVLVQRGGAPEEPSRRLRQMVPLHNSSMDPIGDRGEFLGMLCRAGYEDMRPSDAYLCASICEHDTTSSFYLYNIPGEICFPDDSLETLADIGWEVMTGCRDCMVSFFGVLRHGGHYLGMQIFEEDRDVSESFGLSAYRFLPDADIALLE